MSLNQLEYTYVEQIFNQTNLKLLQVRTDLHRDLYAEMLGVLALENIRSFKHHKQQVKPRKRSKYQG
ncbi:hypothetical protein QUF63_03745 [Anaerolineales bacterium HSG25]|nr:hypothetical protein [Anaerolineales bacterium HSG25]